MKKAYVVEWDSLRKGKSWRVWTPKPNKYGNYLTRQVWRNKEAAEAYVTRWNAKN